MSPKERESFPKNVDRQELFIDPSPNMQKLIDKIDDYAVLVFKTAENDTAGVKFIKYWGILHLYRRLISSPMSLYKSIQNKMNADKDTSYEEIINPNQLSKEELNEEIEKVKENITDRESMSDKEEFDQDYRNDLDIGRNKLPEDVKIILNQMSQMAFDLTGYSNDVKLNFFYNNILTDLIQKTKKIIIFTRYIDTADYLAVQLKELVNTKKMLQGFEIEEIIGTEPVHKRQEKLNTFVGYQKGILIATDCISEGMDLQYAANAVVNYELTWNPNRLEQRNGRVNRFGQPIPQVFIRTIILKESIEIAILDLLYKKTQMISGDMGYLPRFFGNLDAIVDVIDDYIQVVEKNHKSVRFGNQFFQDLRSITRNPNDPKSQLSAMISRNLNLDLSNQVMKDSFYGQTVVNFQDVKERMDELERTIGNVDTLLIFLKQALPFFDSKLEAVNQGNYPSGKVFRVILHNRIRDLLPQNELKKSELLITTDPNFGSKEKNVETLSLKSILLQTIINLIKERGFLAEDTFYGRTTALSSSSVQEVTAIIQYKIRYIMNTIDKAMMEEIIPIGYRIFDNAIEKGGRPLLEPQNVSNLWEEFIKGKMNNHNRSLAKITSDMQELHQRSDFVSITNIALENRKQMLQKDNAKIISEFKKSTPAFAHTFEGMDKLSIISQEPLSILLIYPGGIV
jgi:hypothetical protein